MCSVNSTPEDFSLKTRPAVSEIGETADIKQEPEGHNSNIAAGFNLTSNKQDPDLPFDMYAEKKSESPNTVYQNNPDPYLGSAPNSNTHSPANVSNNPSRQDFSQSSEPNQFAPTSSLSTNDASTSAFSSYLSSNESHSLPAGDLPPTTSAAVRPGSGPPGSYTPDTQLPAQGYRPGSANPLLNRNQEMRSSPAGSLINNHLTNTKIPSPLSPSSQNASPSERPFVTHGGLEYNSTASAFKPLPANQLNHPQPQQGYAHQTPSPHPYNQGSSPSVSGWFYHRLL